MTKRIIEIGPDELATLQGRALLESIRSASGRAVAAEIVAFRPPLIDGVSNAGLAAALGVDIVHLNHYDVNNPQIAGFPSHPEGIKAWGKIGFMVEPTGEIEDAVCGFLGTMGLGVTIHELRAAIGRVVGVSLEVVFDQTTAPPGRQAIPETAARAIQQGTAYITLVATPAHSPDTLAANLRTLRAGLDPDVVLVAGRMPWGGSREGVPEFLDAAEVEKQVTAGADMVMIPAPGTMPGATFEAITQAVAAAHYLGALAEITIGTSQESADEETVRRLAMDSRLTGADIYQIGDGGYGGMAIPENILAFATAIKGKRHTYRRTASTRT